MRMLIMGAPGAGKGTQAALLAARLVIPAISTGDIFRRNVAELTDLGRMAREYMDAGEYVPDTVTNAMVRDRLAEADCSSGFLLDGYPRTLDQAAELDRILAAADTRLDAVVELSVDTETVVARLLDRARHEDRADDTPEVIRHRQRVYAEQTEPLVTHYRDRGLLITVDGLGAAPEVGERIAGALACVVE